MCSCHLANGIHLVVVKFIFRVFPYPQTIWAGPIMLPHSALPQIAKAIPGFIASNVNSKVTMFLYVLKKQLLQSISADQDMLVVHAFDGLGEEHGRKAFDWALSVPGAIDQTGLKSLRQVAELQGTFPYSRSLLPVTVT